MSFDPKYFFRQEWLNLLLAVLYSTSLLFLQGCSATKGLTPSTKIEYPSNRKNLKEFEAALRLVNGILIASSSFRLVETKEANQQLATNEISVSLVKFPRYDRGKVALVPYLSRTILVDGNDLSQAQKNLSSPYTGRSIRIEFLLAIYLLHELGHIQHFDYLKDPPPTRQTQYTLEPVLTNSVKLLPSSYNVDPTAFKEMEDAADLFAGERIRDAMLLTNQVQCWSAAFDLALATSEASMNLQNSRMKSHFGGYVLGQPEVLADEDLGHPNLELRFLRINHYINRSPDTKKLLEDFMRARTNIQFLPKIIYMNTNNGLASPNQNSQKTDRGLSPRLE